MRYFYSRFKQLGEQVGAWVRLRQQQRLRKRLSRLVSYGLS